MNTQHRSTVVEHGVDMLLNEVYLRGAITQIACEAHESSLGPK